MPETNGGFRMFRRHVRLLSRVGPLAAALALYGSSGPAAQEPPLPSARSVIDRSVQAMGGAGAFRAIASMRAKGVFTMVDQQVSGELEMIAARPNRMLTRVTVAGLGQIEEGYDGKIGWSIDPLSGPSLVSGRALQERADEAWFDAPLHDERYVREMTVLARELFDKRPVYRVKVVSTGGTEQIELFDVETGHQIGAEASRETPLGVLPTVSRFGEFRQFGALTFPTRISQRALAMEQVFTLTSYEFDTMPASAFELPAVIKALIK
jgi:hypothetical protein